MPLQNRVTPFGEIIVASAHGAFMGNRGILHDDQRQLGRARWRHKSWVPCRLQHKGIRRDLMAPGNYTELFFLDEATALAGGHRPCAECRLEDYRAFVSSWAAGANWMGKTRPRVGEIDARLHAERVARPGRGKRIHEVELDRLPDGAMAAFADRPDEALLVLGDALLPWSPDGYGPSVCRIGGTVQALTPVSSVGALAAGYRPQMHPSSHRQG